MPGDQLVGEAVSASVDSGDVGFVVIGIEEVPGELIAAPTVSAGDIAIAMPGIIEVLGELVETGVRGTETRTGLVIFPEREKFVNPLRPNQRYYLILKPRRKDVQEPIIED